LTKLIGGYFTHISKVVNERTLSLYFAPFQTNRDKKRTNLIGCIKIIGVAACQPGLLASKKPSLLSDTNSRRNKAWVGQRLNK